MVLSALKPSAEVFTVPPKLFGSEILFSNFVEAWNYLPFGRFILNTIWVAGVGTLITLVASATAGYAFARLNFKFQGGLFILYLSTLIVPQEVIVIPMFLVMQQLGWVNTYKALILPWAFTAFGTFLLRQFFMTIPKELEEAAKIDGATPGQAFRLVILPLAAPGLFTTAILAFIASWNEFLIASQLSNDKTQPVTVAIAQFTGSQPQVEPYTAVMAAGTVVTIPLIILVLILQRRIVEGLTAGGVKG